MARYQMKPRTSHRDRLYLFWKAYNSEAELLQKWFDDANKTLEENGSLSDLYTSFLHTWGGDSFDPVGPLNKKSWFAALHVASVGVCNKCLEVLKSNAKREAVVDVQGEPLFATGKEEQDAITMIEELKTSYYVEKNQLHELDNFAEHLAKVEGEANSYLHVLDRLCKIETNCFDIQYEFLKSGVVPPTGPAGGQRRGRGGATPARRTSSSKRKR